MSKTEQAGTACKQDPGMTSTTGNSVYARTVMNAPANEAMIRGTPRVVPAWVRPQAVAVFGEEDIVMLEDSGDVVFA